MPRSMGRYEEKPPKNLEVKKRYGNLGENTGTKDPQIKTVRRVAAGRYKFFSNKKEDGGDNKKVEREKRERRQSGNKGRKINRDK